MSAVTEQSHTTGTSVLDEVGNNIIHHVSNSSLKHPLINLPEKFRVEEGESWFSFLEMMSVTKHVLMLWIVAVILSTAIILPIQKYMKKEKCHKPAKTFSESFLKVTNLRAIFPPRSSFSYSSVPE